MRALASIAVLLAAMACTQESPQIEIADPVVIATPMGGAAYFTIRNRGGSDRLLSIVAPSIREASMHETVRDGAIMRMRAIDGIDIPAGGNVIFRRGGLHVMLMGSPAALEPGKTIPLTLSFKRAGDMTISAPVKGPDAPMEAM